MNNPLEQLDETLTQTGEPRRELADILERYLADLERGAAPDRATFLAAHADLAKELQPYLDSLDKLHVATQDLRTMRTLGGKEVAEPTAKQIGEYLRAAMSRTLMARIGYVFAKGAFSRLREKLDVRKSNGGVFLGLNGIVVKSHGGTDEEGFAAAIELGYDMVRNKLLSRIQSDLDGFHSLQPVFAARPHGGAREDE